MIQNQDVSQADAQRCGAAANLFFVAQHSDAGQPFFSDFRRGDDCPVVAAFGQDDML